MIVTLIGYRRMDAKAKAIRLPALPYQNTHYTDKMKLSIHYCHKFYGIRGNVRPVIEKRKRKNAAPVSIRGLIPLFPFVLPLIH